MFVVARVVIAVVGGLGAGFALAARIVVGQVVALVALPVLCGVVHLLVGAGAEQHGGQCDEKGWFHRNSHR
jgi:hypothetical protein